MNLLLLSTWLTSALAVSSSPNLILRRQSGNCPNGYKVCGTGCISSVNICCPDGSGGCEPTDNCQLGSNNKYLCCPKGENCVGTGGVRTSFTYSTSSATNGGTTTIVTSSHATTTGSSSACSTGWKACGIYCIPTNYTCCPDKQGGCESDIARCWLGDDGRYGCCRNTASSCKGSAGAATTVISDYTDTTISRTTSRSLSSLSTTSKSTSSTAFPAGVSTTTTNTASATNIAGSASDGHQVVNQPFTSLMSLLMGAIALIV